MSVFLIGTREEFVRLEEDGWNEGILEGRENTLKSIKLTKAEWEEMGSKLFGSKKPKKSKIKKPIEKPITSRPISNALEGLEV